MLYGRRNTKYKFHLSGTVDNFFGYLKPGE